MNLPLLLEIISFPPMRSVTHLCFAHHTAVYDLHFPLHENRAQVPVWVFHPSPPYRGHTFLTQSDSRAADTGSLDSRGPLLGAKCLLLTGSQYLGPEETHLKATKSLLPVTYLGLLSCPSLPILSHLKFFLPKPSGRGTCLLSPHVSSHLTESQASRRFPLGRPLCSQTSL